MDYDKRVATIKRWNLPILGGFEEWLVSSGLTHKTVVRHVSNMSFFAVYLVHYEPIRPLTEATESDLSSFLVSWFPRKAPWASESRIREYLASFKKFFVWARDYSDFEISATSDILEMLREERAEIISEAVDNLL